MSLVDQALQCLLGRGITPIVHRDRHGPIELKHSADRISHYDNLDLRSRH